MIVDTRTWTEFRNGHVEGALFAPLGAAFHSVVGSYVEPEDDIVLVVESQRVDAAVRELTRIGLDRVVAFITPETLKSSNVADAGIAEVEVGFLGPELETKDPVVLDVRRAAELPEGSVSRSAIHVPHTRLPRHLAEIPKDRPVFVHCASGVRSAFAAAYLRKHGVNAINVAGGYRAWKQWVARQAKSASAMGGN